MVERPEIEERVRRWVLEQILTDEEPEALTPSTPLVRTGILDSLSTLRLVGFLEETFGIRIAAHEVTEANLDSVGAIAALVASKV